MISSIEEIKKIVNDSNNIVFFGGAGLGTESGIPDFRSIDGLYNQKYDYPPEEILSASFFRKNPEIFYKFCKEKCYKPMINALPNDAHKALTELEKRGKLKAIITQNIDNLHQKAGSKNVYELHGTMFKNHCMRCGKQYSIDYMVENNENVPLCECGGMIRPDIVLYEEGLDEQVVADAVYYIKQADVLIIAGTSLVVYPAASFINYYKGKKMILINKDKVPNEENIDYVIHGKAGEILKKIVY